MTENQAVTTTDKGINQVAAVSYALQYLTQRIIGDDIGVEFPAATAHDPRDWRPAIQDVSKLQQSDLIIINGPGAEYAKWMVSVTLPDSKICNSCSNFELGDYITVKDFQTVHSHGPEGEHSHPYFVPYTWLNPKFASKQAVVIRDALIKTYPQLSKRFQTNFRSLNSDLNELIVEFEKVSVRSKNQKTVVLTATPNLKYLSQAAGMEDRHFLWFNPAETSVDSSISDTVDRVASETTAKHLLFTEELPTSWRQIITDNGIELVRIDLLDKKPNSGDFLTVTRKNLERLSEIAK